MLSEEVEPLAHISAKYTPSGSPKYTPSTPDSSTSIPSTPNRSALQMHPIHVHSRFTQVHSRFNQVHSKYTPGAPNPSTSIPSSLQMHSKCTNQSTSISSTPTNSRTHKYSKSTGSKVFFCQVQQSKGTKLSSNVFSANPSQNPFQAANPDPPSSHPPPPLPPPSPPH